MKDNPEEDELWERQHDTTLASCRRCGLLMYGEAGLCPACLEKPPPPRWIVLLRRLVGRRHVSVSGPVLGGQREEDG